MLPYIDIREPKSSCNLRGLFAHAGIAFQYVESLTGASVDERKGCACSHWVMLANIH